MSPFLSCCLSLFIVCWILDFMDPQDHLRSGGDGDALVIDQVLLRLHDAVSMAMSRIRQRVMQSFIVLSVVSLLLWLAAFLYGSFYYSYMPRAAFSTPVHYHYRYVHETYFSAVSEKQHSSVLDSLFLAFTLIWSWYVFVCRTDCESPASFSCSFPVANISLMRNKKQVSVCVHIKH